MKQTIVFILTLVVGCENQGGDRCSDPGSVTGIIVSSPMRAPVITDLVVRGVIAVPPNATVYSVQVGGIDATNAGIDFDTWTVTVPLTVLAGQAKDGKVTITANARTNCGSAMSPVGSMEVEVNSMPGTLVSQLALTATLPNAQSYLPSTVSASAIVTVTGNPQAAGASTTLATSFGTITPVQVTLAGDGTANSVGYALFSSTVPGTAVLTATAMGQAASTSIVVIGPPTFAPDGNHIRAGNSLRVTVFTTGKVSSCQATPTPGMHVTSGPQSDLMAGTGGVDQTMDGLIDIDITVDSPLAVSAQTTLSCHDPFGQIGTAVFVADP